MLRHHTRVVIYPNKLHARKLQRPRIQLVLMPTVIWSMRALDVVAYLLTVLTAIIAKRVLQRGFRCGTLSPTAVSAAPGKNTRGFKLKF
jgi:hypothetical protein